MKIIEIKDKTVKVELDYQEIAAIVYIAHFVQGGVPDDVERISLEIAGAFKTIANNG